MISWQYFFAIWSCCICWGSRVGRTAGVIRGPVCSGTDSKRKTQWKRNYSVWKLLVFNMLLKSTYSHFIYHVHVCENFIAERLRARQLILHWISCSIVMYVHVHICIYVYVTLRNAFYTAGALWGTHRQWTYCRTFHVAGRTLVWTTKTAKKEVGAWLHYASKTSSHQRSGSWRTMTLAVIHGVVTTLRKVQTVDEAPKVRLSRFPTSAASPYPKWCCGAKKGMWYGGQGLKCTTSYSWVHVRKAFPEHS